MSLTFDENELSFDPDLIIFYEEAELALLDFVFWNILINANNPRLLITEGKVSFRKQD